MNMGTQGAPPIVAEAPMTFINVKGEQFTFIKAASGVTIAVPPTRKRKARRGSHRQDQKPVTSRSVFQDSYRGIGGGC
jgi:hypothetical protein